MTITYGQALLRANGKKREFYERAVTGAAGARKTADLHRRQAYTPSFPKCFTSM
jgi:hypothetical protein